MYLTVVLLNKILFLASAASKIIRVKFLKPKSLQELLISPSNVDVILGCTSIRKFTVDDWRKVIGNRLSNHVDEVRVMLLFRIVQRQFLGSPLNSRHHLNQAEHGNVWWWRRLIHVPLSFESVNFVVASILYSDKFQRYLEHKFSDSAED